jgi:flotillin
MEEIFTEREQFKKRIYHNIQSELDQFGLKIYNANVKELTDAPNSNYFATLSRKAHEGASNQARVDVAEAQWHGNVGEAERQGRQNREIAKIHAETAILKTERDTEKSQAEALLATRKAAFDRDVNIAKIEASRAVEVKDEQLRKEVESLRAATEIERLRATDVVKATILRESQQQASDSRAYETEKKASADFFLAQKAAEARAYETQTKAIAEAEREKQTAQAKAFEIQAKADADSYSRQKAAEAEAYSRQKAAEAESYKLKLMAEANYIAATKAAEANQKSREAEAEGIAAMADAYAKMSQAFGGPAGLIQYMMLEKNVYGEMARANAQAVQGMQPKITVWNTGAQAGAGTGAEGGVDAGASVRNVYQMLPPLLTTIQEQTGVTLPEWQVGKVGGGEGVAKAEGVVVNGKGGAGVVVKAK